MSTEYPILDARVITSYPPDIDQADDLDEFMCHCEECIENRLLDMLEDRAS